jgi:hypothetical protein
MLPCRCRSHGLPKSGPCQASRLSCDSDRQLCRGNHHALTRTSAKKRLLLDAGATHVIATEQTNLVPEVMRLTGGKGARIAPTLKRIRCRKVGT